jgi:mRNA interferase MazF
MATTINPLRGEIWDADFNPAIGAEIQKIRPCVVVNIASVGRLPLCIVVPITDWKPAYVSYFWFVHLLPAPLNGLAKESGVDTFQIRSMDRRRFIAKRGDLTPDQLRNVAAAIAVSVGYAP